MNFFEAKEFFKNMYPDQLVIFDFDHKCIRTIECVYTDGCIHPINHIEYNRVKVTPQGKPSVYVPIQTHRESVSVSILKSKIPNDEVYFYPDVIATFKELKNDPLLLLMQSYDMKMKEHMQLTGLSQKQIEDKINQNP